MASWWRPASLPALLIGSFAEDPFDYAQGKLSNATLESLSTVAGFLGRVFAEQNSRNKLGQSD